MDKEKLLGWTPYIEVFIRKVYYSDNKLIKKIAGKRKTKAVDSREQIKKDMSAEVYDSLKKLDIEKGDILIIHTSKDELDKVGVNAIELLKFLRNIVGEEGTLVLPAFPLYNEMNFDEAKGMYIYNPQKTVCSTGMLPNIFLRMPKVIRSSFPWNSLAAQGPHAEEMFKNELQSDLAHGRSSAWNYCMEHKAKVLLLGVKASHTTTMVHVAEDILDEDWPVRDWYEDKTVLLEENGSKQEFKLRIRKQEWVKYNASWYRSNQFKKKGILSEYQIGGCNIGFVKDSKGMVDYVIQQTRKHKGFFRVPRRFYKKNER